MPLKSNIETEKKYLELVFNIPLTQTFTYHIDVKGLGGIGKRAIAPFGKRQITGYIIGESICPPSGIPESSIKQIDRIIDEKPIFEKREIELAKWVSSYYFCSLGEALAIMIPSGRRLGTPSAFSDEDDITANAIPLSDEQKKALSAIIETKPDPSLKTPLMFYLYGITGSGKTEVFLKSAETMLKMGKSVIYLVPEISLTHQTIDAIKKRFGQASATLHSGMTISGRFTEWMRIKAGGAFIIVGPRSAVFAPVQNLGLVIIDEEHDGSYKSENTPRYHARQVAIHRCYTENARLVMGSATPSAEAWKLMSDSVINRLDLTQRLSGGSIPEIMPVNLAHSDGCLTNELKEEIRRTAKMGRQTILFLNRRGFGHFYHCKACGFKLSCHQCSVSLIYHKARGKAICHYCGYQTVPPRICPECGSLEAGYSSFGTEMIEEEVKRTFPDLRIRRVDADSTSKKGSLQEVLQMFRLGAFDILLGTQMVAKGLNFPGVRLVGVVLADTGLNLPDFRAAERTFSLIVQVAGRSGRYFPDGKVIVQTMRPCDPIILRACALDVNGFFSAELKQRKALNFPPYSRIIRFTVRSKDMDRAENAINRLFAITNSFLPSNADVLGPSECPIGIIAGNHRRHLTLRCPSMNMLHTSVRSILAEYDKGKDTRVYLEVDVDPVSLL